MPKILSQAEKVVLIGICRYIINSDGVVTDPELAEMNRIAEEMGFDDYQKSFDESDRLITSIDTLQEKIDSLKKSGNQRKILEHAIQLSRCDACIKSDEVDIIVYAADSWDFDIKSLMK
jgi:hypothetical protein